VVSLAQVASAGRMDARFFLDPTRLLDEEYARIRRRMDRDRRRLRALAAERREVLAAHRSVRP
jgi:hypothetical protein